jgi:helix-turn-helix protein
MFDDNNLNDDSPFLTIDEAATLLRIKPRTLDNLRWSGDGPPARRHGGRIVYHRREVLDWSERRRTRTPGQQGTTKAPPRLDGGLRTGRPGYSGPRAGSTTPPVEYEP